MKLRSPSLPCRRLLFVAAWIVFAAGCGGPQGPSRVTVAGTVTLAGQPVEGANVIFHPLEGNEALASQGLTDSGGRFEMATHVGGGNYEPGIVAGKYAVTIVKLDTAAIANTSAPPQNLLPPKYSSPTSTVLKVVVVAGKENDFPFALDAN